MNYSYGSKYACYASRLDILIRQCIFRANSQKKIGVTHFGMSVECRVKLFDLWTDSKPLKTEMPCKPVRNERSYNCDACQKPSHDFVSTLNSRHFKEKSFKIGLAWI